jgi:hypothetical protein
MDRALDWHGDPGFDSWKSGNAQIWHVIKSAQESICHMGFSAMQ